MFHFVLKKIMFPPFLISRQLLLLTVTINKILEILPKYLFSQNCSLQNIQKEKSIAKKLSRNLYANHVHVNPILMFKREQLKRLRYGTNILISNSWIYSFQNNEIFLIDFQMLPWLTQDQIWLGVTVLSTFNNISIILWWSVLLEEKTRVYFLFLFLVF